MDNDKLNIINEDDKIVGEEPREKIHREGLLHREIHVWFLTPEGELILQRRSKDVESCPNLLDATVGGHVEIGESYENTALKEAREETGVEIDPKDLRLLRKMKKLTVDPVTGRINNTHRAQFVYRYDGQLSNLQIEKGKATGFETWSLDKLLCLDEITRNKFVPGIANDKELIKLLKKDYENT